MTEFAKILLFINSILLILVSIRCYFLQNELAPLEKVEKKIKKYRVRIQSFDQIFFNSDSIPFYMIADYISDKGCLAELEAREYFLKQKLIK